MNLSDERAEILWHHLREYGVVGLEHHKLLKCMFFIVCKHGIKAVLDALNLIFNANIKRIPRKRVPNIKLAYAIDYLNSMPEREAALVLLNAFVSTLNDVETIRQVTRMLMDRKNGTERRHRFFNFK